MHFTIEISRIKSALKSYRASPFADLRCLFHVNWLLPFSHDQSSMCMIGSLIEPAHAQIVLTLFVISAYIPLLSYSVWKVR